jgi:L-ascorbate metabolism protein UlaG (beta-lactamase superfamily)
VAGEDATVLVYEGVDPDRIDRAVAPVADLPGDVRRVGEGDRRDVAVGDDATVRVETTPARNDPEGPHVRADGTPYHPPGFGVGYRLVVDDVAVFWPGDTDVLDAHADLSVSLLCPPIGGTYTMDRTGGAELASALDPALTLPVHYDTFDAIAADERAFAADVAARGRPVVLEDPTARPVPGTRPG